jgi:hypothetical protein
MDELKGNKMQNGKIESEATPARKLVARLAAQPDPSASLQQAIRGAKALLEAEAAENADRSG